MKSWYLPDSSLQAQSSKRIPYSYWCVCLCSWTPERHLTTLFCKSLISSRQWFKLNIALSFLFHLSSLLMWGLDKEEWHVSMVTVMWSFDKWGEGLGKQQQTPSQSHVHTAAAGEWKPGFLQSLLASPLLYYRCSPASLIQGAYIFKLKYE